MKKTKVGHTMHILRTFFLGILNVKTVKSLFINKMFREVSGRTFEENVFEMYKNPATNLINIGQVLTVNVR